KSEVRNKSEFPKSEPDGLAEDDFSDFEFRASFGFRISDFGFSRAATSSHTTPNHNGASDVSRLDASFPKIVFGSVPSFSKRAKMVRICFTSSTIPAAKSPRAEINVSRPQSRNHG